MDYGGRIDFFLAHRRQLHLYFGDDLRESRHKKGVGVIDKCRPGTPRFFEHIGLSAQPVDLAQHSLHQFRIAAPEAIDGLLDVPDEHGLFGAAGQLQEQCQLDRAGVLELVHHEQVELLAERAANCVVVHGL